MQTQVGHLWEEAANWLRQNEVVAIPTETVYGLAGNALSEEAVLKIFKAKNRPHFNPLIIHTHHVGSIARFVKSMPAEALAIANQFWPGPITFLLEKRKIIPDLVTAGHHKVAVRVPNHPLTQSLLEALDFPLAAPSANRFGYVSPTTAQHVLEGLNGVIPYVLDGGACTVGLESTILDFEDGQVILRRKGGISAEAIEAVIGKRLLNLTHASDHPVAPGQLKSHYATYTPLFTGDPETLAARYPHKKLVIIGFGPQTPYPAFRYFNLSELANTDEAARNLFSIMRQADAAGGDLILAPVLPDSGLGSAVNDRLKRAAHNNK